MFITILQYLHDNTPLPLFLIALIMGLLLKVEKYVDKKSDHTTGFLVIAQNL